MPETGAIPTSLYKEWKAARMLQSVYRGWKDRLAITRVGVTVARFQHALLCVCCNDASMESASVGRWLCEQCKVPFCESCFKIEHCRGARTGHTMKIVDFRALHEGARMCGNCDIQRASLACKVSAVCERMCV